MSFSREKSHNFRGDSKLDSTDGDDYIKLDYTKKAGKYGNNIQFNRKDEITDTKRGSEACKKEPDTSKESKKPRKNVQLANLIEFNEKKAKKTKKEANSIKDYSRREKSKTELSSCEFLAKIMRDKALVNSSYSKRYLLRKRGVEETAAKIIQKWYRHVFGKSVRRKAHAKSYSSLHRTESITTSKTIELSNENVKQEQASRVSAAPVGKQPPSARNICFFEFEESEIKKMDTVDISSSINTSLAPPGRSFDQEPRRCPAEAFQSTERDYSSLTVDFDRTKQEDLTTSPKIIKTRSPSFTNMECDQGNNQRQSTELFGEKLRSIGKKEKLNNRSKSTVIFEEVEDPHLSSAIKQINSFWEREKEKKDSKFSQYLNFFKNKFPGDSIEGKNRHISTIGDENVDFKKSYHMVIIDLKVSQKLIHFLVEENLRLQKTLERNEQLRILNEENTFANLRQQCEDLIREQKKKKQVLKTEIESLLCQMEEISNEASKLKQEASLSKQEAQNYKEQANYCRGEAVSLRDEFEEKSKQYNKEWNRMKNELESCRELADNYKEEADKCREDLSQMIKNMEDTLSHMETLKEINEQLGAELERQKSCISKQSLEKEEELTQKNKSLEKVVEIERKKYEELHMKHMKLMFEHETSCYNHEMEIENIRELKSKEIIALESTVRNTILEKDICIKRLVERIELFEGKKQY